MKLSRGARRDNLFNRFFRCPSALALICMKLFNICANKLSLSLLNLIDSRSRGGKSQLGAA